MNTAFGEGGSACRPPTAPRAVANLVAQAMVTIPKTHSAETTGADLVELFENEHVHMALIVAPDGRLVTTIERPDLHHNSMAANAIEFGTLDGRTVSPAQELDAVLTVLAKSGRRRLAVVDDEGRLVGLLCVKRDGTGCCSDEGIRERATSTSP